MGCWRVLLPEKGQADATGTVGWDVWHMPDLVCDTEHGLICSLLCFPHLRLASCLPPYFPILALSREVHLARLAVGGLPTSAVFRGTLALVPPCKSCTLITGQHSRDWPRSSALNGLSDNAAGGWGSCIFFFFPFGLSHLLSNCWAPCVVNRTTGLFSDLVIQLLNHTDPSFYPFPEVFITCYTVPEIAKVIK